MLPQDGAALCGFKLWGHSHDGCLTDNPLARLHSCDLGLDCEALDRPNIVFITPVLTRDANGQNVKELGINEGSGEHVQAHEIDISNTESAIRLMELCSKRLTNQEDRLRTMNLITKAMATSDKILPIKCANLPDNLDEVPLEKIVDLLQKTAETEENNQLRQQEVQKTNSEQTATFSCSARIVSSIERLS